MDKNIERLQFAQLRKQILASIQIRVQHDVTDRILTIIMFVWMLPSVIALVYFESFTVFLIFLISGEVVLLLAKYQNLKILGE